MHAPTMAAAGLGTSWPPLAAATGCRHGMRRPGLTSQLLLQRRKAAQLDGWQHSRLPQLSGAGSSRAWQRLAGTLAAAAPQGSLEALLGCSSQRCQGCLKGTCMFILIFIYVYSCVFLDS